MSVNFTSPNYRHLSFPSTPRSRHIVATPSQELAVHTKKMSGLEIAAAVIGIIGTFTSATKSFSDRRTKRKAKKAARAKAAPEEEAERKVDRSLTLGHQAVREEYDTGLVQLGRRFALGDAIGIDQLQGRLI